MKKQIICCVLIVSMLLLSGTFSGVHIPNDTWWNDQWGPEEINIDGAWDYTGKGVLTNPGLREIVIAVIDSGIAQGHPDLVDVTWRNQDEFVGDYGDDDHPGLQGIDDDQDGKADWLDEEVKNTDWNGNGLTLAQEMAAEGGDPTKCDDFEWAILDDDENGYPDDLNGWNFVLQEVDGYDTFRTTHDDFNTDVEDHGILKEDNGYGLYDRVNCQLEHTPFVSRGYHGTHCAGTIAALIDNNEGIAGGGKYSIMPLVIFKADFNYGLDEEEEEWDVENAEYESRLLHAIEYAHENGADIVSMSFGDPNEPVLIDDIDDAIEGAYDDGVLFVASTGNGGNNQIIYPARNPHVIAVGSATTNGVRVEGSNFGGSGSIDERLELSAPSGDGTYVGVGSPPIITVDDDILSTSVDDLSDADDLYVYMGGTSAAAPFVSATAAMVMAIRPSLTAEEVRQVLRMTATDLVNPDPLNPLNKHYGWDEFSGFGMVNAFDAIRYASYQKNLWANDQREHLNNQIANSPDLSIDMDSRGYSHIAVSIWTGTDDIIHWMSLDHRGSIYKGPVQVGGAGRETRIKVDWKDDIHIVWVAGLGVVGNVWYAKINHLGQALINPIQLTKGNNQIYGLDLMTTDQVNGPEAIVVYSILTGGDTDIYQIRIDRFGEPSQPVGLIVRANSQKYVTADIYSASGGLENIQIAFVEGTDNEIHWAVFDLAGTMQDLDNDAQPDEVTITNDNVFKWDLCLKVDYFSGESVLVWLRKPTQQWTPIDLMLHTLSPIENLEGTYFTTYSDLDVGQVLREPVLLDHIDSAWFGSPKVAINSRDEVVVVWDFDPDKKLYFCSLDGRLSRDFELGDSNNRESVIAATYGDSHRRDPFDMDGNFYVAYESFAPLKCLGWISSGEIFEDVNTIETAANRHSLRQTDHVVDDWGGVHSVWCDWDLDGTMEIYYEYSKNNDLSTSTISAVKVSIGLTGDSYDPVIALHSYIDTSGNNKIYGYIAWIYQYDTGERIQYDLYARGFHILSGATSPNWIWGPELSAVDYGQSSQMVYLKDDPEIVDYTRPFIMEGTTITPPEFRYALVYELDYGGNGQDIVLGTVDVNNNNGRIPTTFGGSGGDIMSEPTVDADPLGYIYVAYQYENNNWIYWNQALEVGSSQVSTQVSFNRVYTSHTAYRPIIRVDQDASRSDTNLYYPSILNERLMQILYITEENPDEFTLSVARYRVAHYDQGASQWQTAQLLYDDFEVSPSFTGSYFTNIPQIDAAMDSDNRLHVLMVGDLRMPWPWKWPGHQAFFGLWYLKLDYDSTAITNEMFMNREYSCVGDPSIAIDRENYNTVHCLFDRDADHKIYGFTHTYRIT